MEKGYITNELFHYKNKEVKLITFKRKNQKVQNNNDEKNKLKKRIYVENAIGLIKKNERITTIKDHKIKNFMSFIYLGSLINNLKILNKNKVI